MKKILSLVTLLTALLFVVNTVSADSGQYGQYGQYGGPVTSQSILVDKMVGKPNGTTKGGQISYTYVDNLTPSDPRFKPGATVMFQIKVKNTSNTTLNGIIVTDKIPSYIEPIEGPGAYDEKTRTISFDAGSFAPDQEKVYNLKTQLYGQDKLPADKGLFCATNYAKASNSATSDDDTAQFCVEKEVLGVKAAPKAGPEMNILMLAGEISMLGLGFKLRKKFA